MEEPRLQKPALNYTYVIVWRLNGLYMLRAYESFKTAEQEYYSIVAMLKHDKTPQDKEVYLMMLLLVYS